MLLDNLYKIVKIIAVLCVVPVAIYVCLVLHSLSTVPAKVDAQVTQLRTDVMTKIDTVQDKLLTKVDTVQDKLQGQVTQLATMADSRLGSLETTTDSRLDTMQKGILDTVGSVQKNANDQLTVANNSLTKLTEVYSTAPSVLGARLDRYTDCAANDLCWQNQISQTMLAVRTAGRDTSTAMVGVRDTLPSIEANFNSVSGTLAKDIPLITLSVAQTTSNIEKLTHPRLIDRLFGYTLNAAILYRNLNPVTNIAITGAQLMSQK